MKREKKKGNDDKIGKLIILKAQFDRLIFNFAPECKLPEKRLDSLVDRIFNGMYLEKRREKRKSFQDG